MAKQLVFDVRFKDSTGIGQSVSPDLRVDIFEEGETLPFMTRHIGSDPNFEIFETSDVEGTLYTTTVDGATLSKGGVTAKWYAKINGSPVSPYPYVETLSNIFADNELTVGDIKAFIKNMLGFPGVSVELTGQHYSAIIEEALTLYGQHIPAERVKRLNITAGQQYAHLPELPYNGPYDVKFTRKVLNPIASDPIFGREYLRSGDMDLGTLILGKAYLETSLRVLSSEPDWRWLHENKELYINIGPGISAQVYGGYDISIRYFVPVTLDKVREDHYRWFRRYCLSQAKKILAQIRGKFSGSVPAPGMAITLNHAELMSEGVREEDQLVEEIRSMASHIPPMFG